MPKNIPGIKNRNVCCLTCLDDVEFIKKRLPADVIVLGAGMIGLKAAEAIHLTGNRVRVVELSDRVLPAVLDNEASGMLVAWLKEHAINILLNTTIQEIKRNHVILDNNKKLMTDILVIAIGIVPNLDFVRGTKIKTNRGIIIDDFAMTNIKDIYAAGDVTESFDIINRKHAVTPLWPLAYIQGEVAGKNMAGTRTRYKGGFAMNSIDILGLPIISAGTSNIENQPGSEILKRVDPNQNIYKKVIIQNNRISGYLFMNEIDRAGILTGLITDMVDISSFKKDILGENFGYIYVPVESRPREVFPLEI